MTDLTALAAEVGFPHPLGVPGPGVAAAPEPRSTAALGRLVDLARWLAEVQGSSQPLPPRRVRLVVFVAEHGIAAAAVSASTAADVAAAVEARQEDAGDLLATAGAGCAVHVLRPASGRIDRQDALSAADVSALVQLGAATADREVDAGADLLIPVALGVGATTVAATLVSVLTDREPVKVVGRGAGPGIDDETWMRKAEAIRDARRRGMPVRLEPDALIATVGGADVAAVTGFLLRAAARRTPVLLDGSVVSAAALMASFIQPRIVRWWRPAHRSPEPAHAAALDRFSLEPVLDLGLRVEDGTGPLLAVPVVQAAARLAAR